MKFKLPILFNKSKHNPSKIEGYIGYYGLEEWWINEFSEKERNYIESVYQPF